MTWLRAFGRFFEQKIGLHRLGILLSLIIIAIAAVVLYRKLHNINVGKVLTAMATVEYRDVAISALFVAAGYFTLTFYDLFALRTIGRKDALSDRGTLLFFFFFFSISPDSTICSRCAPSAARLPYRIAALAGFTSYSVGHNVGASVFTGGAVRYRIYSAWGLDAIEVAKICFIAGLTFWLGNITVLGFGFAYHPQAASDIDQLPLWLNRALGIVGAHRAGRLRRLGVAHAARHRPAELAGPAAERSADAVADRHRHRRSVAAARWRCTCWCRTSRTCSSSTSR